MNPPTSAETHAASDPFATQSFAAWRFLHGLNPLSKAAAVLPAIVALVFTRDLVTPIAFLVLCYLLLLVGARSTVRLVVTLAVGMPLTILVIGAGFALWADPAEVNATPVLLQVGAWKLHVGAITSGLSTSLRLAAILLLAVVPGATTNGPDLVRAAVQQLRLPYRIGYAALAAYRFVPRFAHELDVIRAAHRVRGRHGGGGPFSRIARAWGYLVPLLASAIRHAEGVALAMDARAFGAYETRTERHLVPWRVRDTAFIALLWASTISLLIWL